MASSPPIIGSWYRAPGINEVFEVVALEEDDGTVEIQYAGGEVDELDIESWNTMAIAEVGPPDPEAGYEVSPEDEWSDERFASGDWSSRIDSIEPDVFPGTED